MSAGRSFHLEAQRGSSSELLWVARRIHFFMAVGHTAALPFEKHPLCPDTILGARNTVENEADQRPASTLLELRHSE